MAEDKDFNGVGKVTNFKVHPSLIKIKEGYNVRPIDLDHVAAMEVSYLDGAIFPAMEVFVENGEMYVNDGHHRQTMYLGLLAKGIEIESVEVRHFRGNDADRKANQGTTASGLPLTPLQRGLLYKQLSQFGWDNKKIATRMGKTIPHVAEMINLANSDTDVQELVATNQISGANALKMAREHGGDTGKVIKSLVEKNGKKVTAKSLNEWLPPYKVLIPALDSANNLLNSLTVAHKVYLFNGEYDEVNLEIPVNLRYLQQLMIDLNSINDARKIAEQKIRDKQLKASQMPLNDE